MNSYVLSNEADLDIEDITEYSIKRWGVIRAERYMLDLHGAFDTLAEFPDLGRDFGQVRPGYFWFEHDSHSLFYRKTADGVFIVRVLHEKQLPDKQI